MTESVIQMILAVCSSVWCSVHVESVDPVTIQILTATTTNLPNSSSPRPGPEDDLHYSTVYTFRDGAVSQRRYLSCHLWNRKQNRPKVTIEDCPGWWDR